MAIETPSFHNMANTTLLNQYIDKLNVDELTEHLSSIGVQTKRNSPRVMLAETLKNKVASLEIYSILDLKEHLTSHQMDVGYAYGKKALTSPTKLISSIPKLESISSPTLI